MRVRDYAAFAALAAAAACGSSTTQPMNNNNAPCPASSHKTIVTLAVGGVEAVTVPANLDCVSFASADGSAGSFLVVAANADTKPDVTGTYDLAVAQPTTPAAEVMAAGRIRSAAIQTDLSGAGSTAEGRFRAMERRVLHLDQPSARSAAAAFMRRASVGVHTASVPNVGDTLTFKVPNATATNSCATFTTQRAVVKTVGEHGIIVQDVTAPAGGFTTAAFDSIETEFDQIIYPTDTVHFGSPSDIDGNGHVFLLFTPQVNAATPRGSHGILAGFFFDGDLFPSTGANSCAESNEGEIFYLLTPDPTGQFSDVRSTSSVRQSIRGTIAHEFQHMINAGVRLLSEGAPDEATWLNEGLSHFAEELVGRAEDDFSDTQKLVIGDVADFPSLNNFNAFFGQNMARLHAEARCVRRDERACRHITCRARRRVVAAPLLGRPLRGRQRRVVHASAGRGTGYRRREPRGTNGDIVRLGGRRLVAVAIHERRQRFGVAGTLYVPELGHTEHRGGGEQRRVPVGRVDAVRRKYRVGHRVIGGGELLRGGRAGVGDRIARGAHV